MGRRCRDSAPQGAAVPLCRLQDLRLCTPGPTTRRGPIFLARRCRPGSPAEEAAPGWAPKERALQTPAGAGGLLRAERGATQGPARVATEVARESPEKGAAPRPASSLLSAWGAHLPVAVAGPGGCRGAAAPRGFSQSPELAEASLPFKRLQRLGRRGPDSTVELWRLGWAR